MLYILNVQSEPYDIDIGNVSSSLKAIGTKSTALFLGQRSVSAQGSFFFLISTKLYISYCLKSIVCVH